MVTSTIKTGLIALSICLMGNAQVRVLLNESFPYRIVCEHDWVETVTNDSTLVLDHVSSGTKTRFQLKKYGIDSTFNHETFEWSRLSFAINKEWAIQIGKLVFVDTGATKQLGGFRAFEMFAFFAESTATQKVWWAEYCRWTDHDGFGYLVSIIGDTLEMKQNYQTYKTLFDSISISRIYTPISNHRTQKALSVSRDPISRIPPRHDLLGRCFPVSIMKGNRILVGKKNQHCHIR